MATENYRHSLDELAFRLHMREISEHLAAMHYIGTAATIRGLQLRAAQTASPLTRWTAEALAAATGVTVPWPDKESTAKEDGS